MNQRSFKFGDAVSYTQRQKEIFSSNMQKSVPSETKTEDSTHVEDLFKEHRLVMAEQTELKPEEQVDPETPKPRKAYPIHKVNQPATSKPSLRPKKALRPVEKPLQGKSLQPVIEPSPAALASSKHHVGSSVKPLERKALPFGDRYERITTYLEKPLFQRVHELHQRGEIAKIAALLNAAVSEYLDRHYQSR